MATRKALGTKVQEGETPNYQATVRDASGTVVDLTDANTDVFLSLYRDDTKAAINSRDNQQVITAGVASNEHTGTAAGVLTFKLTTSDTNLSLAADTTIVLRYTVSFNDGAAVSRTGIAEATFVLEPLDTVV